MIFISFILYYIIIIIIIIIYYIYLPLPQKIHRCLPEEGNSFAPSGILEMSTLLEYVYKVKPIHTVRILYSVHSVYSTVHVYVGNTKPPHY